MTPKCLHVTIDARSLACKMIETAHAEHDRADRPSLRVQNVTYRLDVISYSAGKAVLDFVLEEPSRTPPVTL